MAKTSDKGLWTGTVWVRDWLETIWCTWGDATIFALPWCANLLHSEGTWASSDTRNHGDQPSLPSSWHPGKKTFVEREINKGKFWNYFDQDMIRFCYRPHSSKPGRWQHLAELCTAHAHVHEPSVPDTPNFWRAQCEFQADATYKGTTIMVLNVVFTISDMGQPSSCSAWS